LLDAWEAYEYYLGTKRHSVSVIKNSHADLLTMATEAPAMGPLTLSFCTASDPRKGA